MDNSEKQRLQNAIFYPIILCVLIVFVFAVEKLSSFDFKDAGLAPHKLKGLIGVFTMPFLHADLKHLLQNMVPLFVLMLAHFYFYRGIALKSFALMWFFSGFILWFIGRESVHIGVSGLVYALMFFLFFSGVFRRHVPLIAISAIVVFLYGSTFWSIFPWKAFPEISWEGHLSGALTGIIFAVIFRKKGEQKPPEDLDDDISDENPYWLEESE